MYFVDVAQLAKVDLAASLRYITDELYNPQAASRLLAEFENRRGILEQMPYTFPLVRNNRLAKKGIRALPVKNFLLFYTIDEIKQQVSIIRFLHGRRDWQHIIQ
jgi:toxin ParE1/3/4